MFRFRAPAARRRSGLFLGFVVSAICSVASTCAFATEPTSIVRIEEDWRLDIITPETASNSPQITCAMSPAGSDEGEYMTFELNHQSQPGYSSGGLHLHAWNSEYLLGSSHSAGVCLATPNETISWTQSMSLVDGWLVYEISQGTSQTWGEFGPTELRVALRTNLTNLNSYDPDSSLRDSGVGFGANRVSSLTLRTVRLFTADGDVIEVVVNRDVTNPN